MMTDRKTEGRAAQLVRLLLFALFLFAGITKLIGMEGMRDTFQGFGYSEEFRVLIGVLETLGAIGLMVPGLVFWAALGLAVIMIGAIFSHLSHDPFYTALPALAVLGLLATIAWRRREAIRPRSSRLRTGRHLATREGTTESRNP